MGRAGGLKSCKTMQKIISTSLIALRSLQGPGSSAPCVGDVTVKLGASTAHPGIPKGRARAQLSTSAPNPGTRQEPLASSTQISVLRLLLPSEHSQPVPQCPCL